MRIYEYRAALLHRSWSALELSRGFGELAPVGGAPTAEGSALSLEPEVCLRAFRFAEIGGR